MKYDEAIGELGISGHALIAKAIYAVANELALMSGSTALASAAVVSAAQHIQNEAKSVVAIALEKAARQ